MSTTPPRPEAPPAAPPRPVVQVVDDAPESLGFLCDALDAAGYRVLVAHSGEAALEGCQLIAPDAILMDAMMPGGLDGFETCRRLKAEPTLSHVSVIFMTGLAETAHIVEGFAAGGVDYVVKPVRVEEVLARLATHVRNAHLARRAREAVAALQQRHPLQAEPPARLRAASLTPRETEVLSWLAKGKTNRDIADILGMSPRTVNKHLEHIFEKLGVETRAAAAALASQGLGAGPDLAFRWPAANKGWSGAGQP
jgi:DNA-binding NarL/FixJ family response regulator